MPQKPVPAPAPPPPSPFWSTADRVPDVFPNTQENVGTLVNSYPWLQRQAPKGLGGILGFYQPRGNAIVLAPGFPPQGDTGMHETGHAIWSNDLTPAQREDWAVQHVKELKREGVPLEPVASYSGDPSHSFAEAYGMYAADPVTLQRQSPEAYNLIRSMAQFEYRRPEHWQEIDQLQREQADISRQLAATREWGPKERQLHHRGAQILDQLRQLGVR